MNLGTITQSGYDLIHDIGSMPLQHSADVTISFVKDTEYTGYAAVPSIGFYDGSAEKVMEMPLADDSTFKLPAEVFKGDGEIAIAVALSNDTETIVAGTVCLYVQKAPGGVKVLPSDHTWENLVIAVMNQYNKEVITPKIDDLMADVKEQQDIVDQKMSDLDVMVSSGAFDGSYWLSGIGVPDSKTGRDRDWYIDLDTDRWMVYRKDGDTWTDTNTYMRGADGSMGGDTVPVGSIVHFTGTSTEPGWLVCDGTEVSRKEYSKLFEVIGTSYGEGDGSKTFNLPDEPNPITYQQLENGAIQFEDRVPGVKVIIKARQDVPIVAKVENDLTSDSEDDAASVHMVRNALRYDNVLINSDFRQPINQKGKTIYTSNDYTAYTIDAWRIYNATVEVLDDCIKVSNTTTGYGYFSQPVEEGVMTIGKDYTSSFEIIESQGITNAYWSRREGDQPLHEIKNGLNVYGFEHSNEYAFAFRLDANSSFKISWAKVDESILNTPLVPIPCAYKRLLCAYLYQVTASGMASDIYGVFVNDTTFYGFCPLSSPLRIKPTAKILDTASAKYVGGKNQGKLTFTSVFSTALTPGGVYIGLRFSSANVPLYEVVQLENLGIEFDAGIY